MAESKKRKKIVKVVDIVRVNSPKKELRSSNKNYYQEESNPVKELEEIIASKKANNEIEEENFDRFRRGKNFRKLIFGVIGLVAVFLIVYVAVVVMPKAEIRIVTKKINWTYQSSIVVNKNISKVDAESIQIPGEIITQQKNVVLQFTPTGQKYVEQKAFGMVTLYNAYSSAPQTLVATTRLQAPDGRIYRITETIIIPGAKVEDGKITPSSITVRAFADKPGPEYNSGPIEKLTIPGFAGSPKYNGFYASAPDGFSGGFVGEGLYPTDSDIAKAKDQAQQALSEAMTASLQSQIPTGFVYDRNSILATTTKIVINPVVGNQFSVVAEGSVSVMTYKESDVLDLMSQLARKEDTIPKDYQEISRNFTYGKSTVDWKLGRAILPIDYKSVFAYPFDLAQLTNSILGKSEIDLKAYILSLSGIDKLSVSFWPFWVRSVPKNASKVKVTIE